MDKDSQMPFNDRVPYREVSLATMAECRENTELYDSPSGIGIMIGNIEWTVTYWPEWDDNPESLNITRGTESYESPVAYMFRSDGTVIKNDTSQPVSGGAYFDGDMDHLVEDQDEIETLKSIVIAAHNVRKL